MKIIIDLSSRFICIFLARCLVGMVLKKMGYPGRRTLGFTHSFQGVYGFYGFYIIFMVAIMISIVVLMNIVIFLFLSFSRDFRSKSCGLSD